MSSYIKFMQKYAKSHTLRGGPFARWRYPLAQALYRRRIEAGPEPERPRSVWSNWNYETELYAFGKRLNENFKDSLLRKAFLNPSFAEAEKIRLKELGIEFDETQNNLELSQAGHKICRVYLHSVLRFWYDRLPDEGIKAIVDHLTSFEVVNYVAKNLGMIDLIRSEEFPPKPDTIYACFMAVIAALAESTEPTRAQLFINDFLLTQLIGKDINEIWAIPNPMGLLVETLKKQGHKSKPVPRLIWSTGASNASGAFIVGIYLDEKFLAKAGGESVEIAEEMAARDALKRLFGTTEDAAALPFGDRARRNLKQVNEIFQKKYAAAVAASSSA